MSNFFDAIVFDKKKIMAHTEQRKVFSYLYVIGLVLGTSLLVILLKVSFFNYELFSQNLSQVKDASSDVLVYKDNVNSVSLKEGQLVFNGENMGTINSLKRTLNADNFEELSYVIKENKQPVMFLLFIYQYLISMKYLITFIALLIFLAYSGKRQAKIVNDISKEKSLTYTSYILTIPILSSMLLLLLNFRFSLILMIIVGLSVGLEFLFMKYYVKEKVIENERKEMVA